MCDQSLSSSMAVICQECRNEGKYQVIRYTHGAWWCPEHRDSCHIWVTPDKTKEEPKDPMTQIDQELQREVNRYLRGYLKSDAKGIDYTPETTAKRIQGALQRHKEAKKIGDTPERTYTLCVQVRTNMTREEAETLAEGMSIGVTEFGKEGIDMPRYAVVSDPVVIRTFVTENK